MRWIIIYLLLTASLFADLQYLAESTGPDLNGNSQGFETVNNNYSQNYQRSGQQLDDSLDENVPIGFAFPFNGSTYTQIIISSNGALYFRSSGAFNNNTERSVAAHYNNVHLNTNSGSNYAMDNALFPYWDDLNPNQGGSIKYGTIGSGSGQHFVVSWENVPHYNNSGAYSFQVALYKDGTIIYRYDRNSDADGSSATIGAKENSSHYHEYSYNTSINQDNDLVYRPYRHLSHIVPSCVTPTLKIGMSTYNTNGYGSYPKDPYEYQALIQNYATNTKLFGSGYQDNIDGSGNPYGSNDDYLSIFKGYLYAPDTGIYKVGVDGDDAVEVYIDDLLITGWYGGHGRHNHEEYAINTYIQAGWHKISYHHQERGGGDNYYLYWQRPGGNMEKVPASRFYHCGPIVTKTSCIINDPVNASSNPKRIPGGIIRYAVEVDNTHFDAVKMDNVLTTDSLDSHFDTNTISNLKIDGSHACDCLNPTSTGANGSNGGVSGNEVKLDYDNVDANTTECGYFEVQIK